MPKWTGTTVTTSNNKEAVGDSSWSGWAGWTMRRGDVLKQIIQMVPKDSTTLVTTLEGRQDYHLWTI